MNISIPPRVSVILPTYNRLGLPHDALDIACKQQSGIGIKDKLWQHSRAGHHYCDAFRCSFTEAWFNLACHHYHKGNRRRPYQPSCRERAGISGLPLNNGIATAGTSCQNL
jgi:hypothetical protein